MAPDYNRLDWTCICITNWSNRAFTWSIIRHLQSNKPHFFHQRSCDIDMVKGTSFCLDRLSFYFIFGLDGFLNKNSITSF